MLVLENGALWSGKTWLPRASVVVDGPRIKNVFTGPVPAEFAASAIPTGAKRFDLAARP